jgi:hypothetical protein
MIEIITACFAFQSIERNSKMWTGDINADLPKPVFLLNAVRARPLPGGARFSVGDGRFLFLHIGVKCYLKAPLAALDQWLVLSPADLRLDDFAPVSFHTSSPAAIFVRGLEYRQADTAPSATDAAALDRALMNAGPGGAGAGMVHRTAFGHNGRRRP